MRDYFRVSWYMWAGKTDSPLATSEEFLRGTARSSVLDRVPDGFLVSTLELANSGERSSFCSVVISEGKAEGP